MIVLNQANVLVSRLSVARGGWQTDASRVRDVGDASNASSDNYAKSSFSHEHVGVD